MGKEKEKIIANFGDLDVYSLKFINRVCDFCGNKKELPVYSVPFLGLKFSFMRCLSCGLIYQNPVLDKESLKNIYESLEYWEGKLKTSAKYSMLNYYQYLEEKDMRQQNANIRIKQISPYLEKNARILDLGCSDGLFVAIGLKAGYRITGIDVSETMISYGCKTYGVDIQRVDFEDEWPFAEPFDAITCYATLSNIVNPSRVFSNIRKHLRPGGYFFFNFGDCSRLISRLLGSRLYLYRPTACTIYTKKTVINYCHQHNFRLQEILNDVQIVSIPRLIGYFRIPGLIRILKLLRLEDTSLKMTLLTGYMARAVRDS